MTFKRVANRNIDDALKDVVLGAYHGHVDEELAGSLVAGVSGLSLPHLSVFPSRGEE
jgi:hypothetical protein